MGLVDMIKRLFGAQPIDEGPDLEPLIERQNDQRKKLEEARLRRLGVEAEVHWKKSTDSWR